MALWYTTIRKYADVRSKFLNSAAHSFLLKYECATSVRNLDHHVFAYKRAAHFKKIVSIFLKNVSKNIFLHQSFTAGSFVVLEAN